MRMQSTDSCASHRDVRQQGFTLLEVMIALVIFSIGLLGLAGLQAEALRYNNGAYQRSQATFLVNDIMDRMRANRDSAINGNYDIALGTNPPSATCVGTGASCDAAATTAADLYEWKQALRVLAGGDGSVAHVTTGASTTFTVTVQWDDRQAPGGISSLSVRGEL